MCIFRISRTRRSFPCYAQPLDKFVGNGYRLRLTERSRLERKANETDDHKKVIKP